MSREEYHLGPQYPTSYLSPGSEVGGPPRRITPFERFWTGPTRVGEVQRGTGVDASLLAGEDVGNVELLGEEVGDIGEDVGNVELLGDEVGDVGEDVGNVELLGEDEVGNVEILGEDGAVFGVEVLGNEDVADAERLSAAVGADVARRVIETARDRRQPPPPMACVDEDAPPRDTRAEEALVGALVAAAEVSGNPEPFPIVAELMRRAGAGMKPRFVRVDTPETYRAFRAGSSPEMAALAARMDAIEAALAAHKADPDAHRDAYEEVVEFVGAVQDAEAAKKVHPWLRPGLRGKTEHWAEGGNVGTTMAFQCGRRLVTSLEPERDCVAEMAQHVRASGVPASAVLGALPAMARVLGAGTIMKEVAAAAPAIVARPEYSGREPFVVRVEPAACPALVALAMLALKCRHGDAAACAEWQRLGASSPPPVTQTMREALALVQRGVESGRLPGSGSP